MSNQMIAVCGLDCSACPAHLAWKNDDQALREKTAREWTDAFKFPFAPAMINCSGCRVAEGPKVGHCAECRMRSCAMQKRHETCAACGDFATCAEIQGFFAHAPEAKANLAKLRA